MVRYIAISFGVLGLGFYELSGGSDFEPAQWREVKAPAVEESVLETPPEDVAAVQTLKVETKIDDNKGALLTASAKDENPLLILASVPTTRRLVGAAVPTPTAERAILGPEEQKAVALTSNEDRFAQATVIEEAPDFRRVSGSRVNMRNGPGTEYSVIGKLVRGNDVQVLQDPGFGWVKLQVVETGRVGWMSASLLKKVEF
ncbi:MAG: SH3 domain-containing protein [Pseudomonadota bacterium]|nr:SH3 domain-containing protein [Pseudomonadota bacterium]